MVLRRAAGRPLADGADEQVGVATRSPPAWVASGVCRGPFPAGRGGRRSSAARPGRPGPARPRPAGRLRGPRSGSRRARPPALSFASFPAFTSTWWTPGPLTRPTILTVVRATTWPGARPPSRRRPRKRRKRPLRSPRCAAVSCTWIRPVPRRQCQTPASTLPSLMPTTPMRRFGQIFAPGGRRSLRAACCAVTTTPAGANRAGSWGVARAVDEFALALGLPVRKGRRSTTWWIRKCAEGRVIAASSVGPVPESGRARPALLPLVYVVNPGNSATARYTEPLLRAYCRRHGYPLVFAPVEGF